MRILLQIPVLVLALSAAVIPVGAMPGPAAPSAPQVAVIADAPRGERWLPPVGSPLRVEEPYRAPEHAYGPGHRGIDLPAVAGARVAAPAAGEVSFAGTVVDRPLVSIRVDARTVVTMEPVAPAVGAGDPVERGQLIGVRAAGGHCGTACVHLGVRVDGEYVNPMRFFAGRPILLPE